MGEEAQIKYLSDRLKLVQSFDPVTLKLSTWPFDRAVLVTYGITPILTLLTPLMSLYMNRVSSREINRPVLVITPDNSPQFLPERGWLLENAKLSNVGKTAALDVSEANLTVHSEMEEDSCFTVEESADTATTQRTLLPGASETLSYVIVVGGECLDSFKSSDPLPTVNIASMFSYTDRVGTKGEQTFNTAVVNPRSIISGKMAKQ